MNHFTVTHDAAAQKFYIQFPEGEAALHYKKIDEKTLDYYSTFVPPQLRGKNIAAVLVKAGLDYANEHHYKIIPSCSYVKTYLQRHSS
jgi:predicted GNAT family acetyltransferase